MKKILITVVVGIATLLCFGYASASDSAAPLMDDYVVCAVYYRMIVGSMSARYGSGQTGLIEIPKQNMADMMELARTAASKEYGEELGEELFQDQWRAEFKDMTDQINRNYDNIIRLKVRYDKRCHKLGGKSWVIGSGDVQRQRLDRAGLWFIPVTVSSAPPLIVLQSPGKVSMHR